MLTVRELKEILGECNDDDLICLEYNTGWSIELDRGDRIRDLNSEDIEIDGRYVTIVF